LDWVDNPQRNIMPETVNPYIAGNPVTGIEMFFGREDVFGFIRQALTGQHRDNVIVLYGQRRTGKTSVLYQMRRHLDARYLPIFVDLHGLALESISGFLWELANHIMRVLHRDYQIDLPSLNRVEFMTDPRSHFENEFLNQVWLVIGDRHILLMLDEAIRLQEQVRAGKLEKDIFEYLRHLMQHHERLNFLFSLGSGLEEMEKEYSFLFSVGLYKKISFLNRDAAINLITQPVKEYYQVEPLAVERILQITSGHPYHTQLLCHSLFNRWQRQTTTQIQVEDVDAILNEVVERGLAVLKHVWEESTSGEKAIIAGMVAVMGESNRPVSPSDIDRVWTRHNVILPEGEKARAIKSLLARDVIAGRDKHVFKVDLQRLWVQKYERLEWVKEEIADTVRGWATSAEPVKRIPGLHRGLIGVVVAIILVTITLALRIIFQITNPTTPQPTNTTTPQPTNTTTPQPTNTTTPQPTNTSTSQQSESSNYALSLDGINDYVNISSISTLGLQTISFTAWVMPKSIEGERGIILRGDPSNRYGVSLGIKDGQVWVGGNSGSGWNNSFVGKANADEWTHITAVYQQADQTIDVYINSEFIATASGRLFTIDRDDFNTVIGKNQVGFGQFFYGSIDEVSIWSRALTSEDISAIMAHSIEGNEPGLVAYWPFNEGSGDTVLDRSDNHFSGLLTNTRDDKTNPVWIISTVPRPVVIFDDFNGPSLAPEWTWIDPGSDANYGLGVRPGFLRISTPSNNDLIQGNNYDAPRLLRWVSGDFDIRTLVEISPTNNYEGAGILIWQDDNNFLRLEYGYGGLSAAESAHGIVFDRQANGKFEAVVPIKDVPTTVTQVELRVQRAGNQFTTYWRKPDGFWQKVGTTTMQLAPQVEAGLVVIAQHKLPQTSADFDYFEIIRSP